MRKPFQHFKWQNKGWVCCTLCGLEKQDVTNQQRGLETWKHHSHLSAELRWAHHQVQKQYSSDISPQEFTLLNKGQEPAVEIFKHDILNIYCTLWSLNLIPFSQNSNKWQSLVGANFITHLNVRPPMYPESMRVHSRLQSHITRIITKGGMESKTFLFYFSPGCYEQEYIFPTTWWFCVHGYCRNTDSLGSLHCKTSLKCNWKFAIPKQQVIARHK